MPWGLVYRSDEIDERNERAGVITFTEAARRAGRANNLRWVHRMIEAGAFRGASNLGRGGVDESSFMRFIEIHGTTRSLEEQCEELRSLGRHDEALGLLERVQAEANARMKSQGVEPSAPSPAAVSRDVPSLADHFLNRFGRG